MSTAPDIVEIALSLKPNQVTLVPERRQEVTTEGGLDVASQKEVLKDLTKRFKEKDMLVSLFIDPDPMQIQSSEEVGAELIELHTGAYANAPSEGLKVAQLARLRQSALLARERGLRVNAGHGLNYHNVGPIVKELGAEELHIGHSIVSRAVFVGIKRAVEEMKELIYRHSLLAR
jgi:pyridoxine 5-phosphate synthase